MKKYIIPETLVVVPIEDILQGVHNESGSGDQLSNGALFDDMDDNMDITFKHKSHIWDEEKEAR